MQSSLGLTASVSFLPGIVIIRNLVMCCVTYCIVKCRSFYTCFFAVAALFCCSLVFVPTFQRRSDINKRAQKRTQTSKNTFIVRIFLECFLYRIHLSVVLLLLSLTFYSLLSFLFFFSNEIVSFGNKKARHNNLVTIIKCTDALMKCKRNQRK